MPQMKLATSHMGNFKQFGELSEEWCQTILETGFVVKVLSPVPKKASLSLALVEEKEACEEIWCS
jgi:hypothetical protein